MSAGTLLAVNRDNTYVVNNNISGAGALRQMGAGTTVLNGANTYTGATSVDAGTLLVNGTLASPTVTIAPGATLGGTGILAGAVILGAGATIAPGAAAAGTLTVGMLALNSGSLLDFELGTPNVVGGPNDLIAVDGDLTLAGTINITDAGNFASTPGSYRLFNYTGALTNNTLNVGSTPGYGPGEAVVQTVIPGKVDLVVSSGMNVAFWDGSGPQDNGSIDGGAQIWNNASANWTNLDGGINQSWLNGMAIFEASAGTVALGANVQARALQFSSTGYVIDGGAFSIQMNQLPSGASPLVGVDPGVTATINAAITGTTGLNKAGTGTLILGGTNIYSGTTTIDGGILLVNGSLTSSPVVVNGSAKLGGLGTILGAVTINSGGTLSPGNSPGTLTVGSLNLVSGSILNYELDTPGVVGGGVNDLIIVTGNLTLAGTLNVAGLGGFGLGMYRLMNYGGALTNNGLLFGTLPDGFVYALQTNVAGEINLAVGSTTPGPIQYWDGSNSVGNSVVDGGSGIWTAGSTNWTTSDGAFNQPWSGQTAVFSGAAGSVAVVGPVAFNSLRFETNGYVVFAGSGGVLTTNTPDSVVLLAPAVTATIGVPIAGSGGLDVQGAGTLILTSDNSYTGGTLIAAESTLQLDGGGAIVGGVVNDGTLIFNRADTIAFGGTIAGGGRVVQNGAGTVVLSGTNSYAGGTLINAGVVSVSADANLGAASGVLTLHGGTLQTTADMASARPTTMSAAFGTIETTGLSTFTLSGVVSGAGGLVKAGTGTLVLAGANTYGGGTLVGAGTLSISSDGNLGAASAQLVLDNGTLQTTASFASTRPTTLAVNGGVFSTNGGTTFTVEGTVDGTGSLTKTGGVR